MATLKPHQPSTSPIVRVFVSSTFRDMQAEREELVKRIFPRLRKLCEQRGVTWFDVDLRWGITDEQTAEGQVLPICLAEIQRCRPYFIGLLGERYGWVPDEIHRDLIARQPWLAEHLHRSVTELEVLHGVLNNPDMAEHAFFYFRDPAYVDSLPAGMQAAFREEVNPDEVAERGKGEARRRAEERRRRLGDLKERIRNSVRQGRLKNPVRENYAGPQALGELVYQDLKRIIDLQFPEGLLPDSLDREAFEHEAFARSRTRIYVSRPEYLALLERHADGSGPPLVVLGEAGAGKTALLANWALAYRDRHAEGSAPPLKSIWQRFNSPFKAASPPQKPPLVILHLIGATAASADWISMLRRLMAELQRRFQIPGQIPDRPEKLSTAFANWLHLAAARGRTVIILDGLNQLEDKDGAQDLVWLPPVIPDNIRLILSSLSGRPCEELKKRGWLASSLTVEPLTVDERRELIHAYLEQYTKELGSDLEARVAGARQTDNPLYLRTLLEELRLYGDHQTLSKKLTDYLEADTAERLYEKVLTRWEDDYDRDHPGLVKDAMTLLWAARRGLSEAELLDLLGQESHPLPAAFWSPLYLAAEASLVNRGGLLSFGHDYLGRAVRRRYLDRPEEQQHSHLRLAGYFQGQEISSRKIEELPWQFSQAQAWPRLYEALADLQFLAAAWKANEFEVKTCWAKVEACSPMRILDAYRGVQENPDRHATDHVWVVLKLLEDTGHLNESQGLRSYLAECFAQAGDLNNLARVLHGAAEVCRVQGDLERAMEMQKRIEVVFRRMEDWEGLAHCILGQAQILMIQGDPDGASRLLKDQERLCRDHGHLRILAALLSDQALILKTKGDLDGALALLAEQERICIQTGDMSMLLLCHERQSQIFRIRGLLGEAMEKLKRAEQICRDLGDILGLQGCLGSQALILRDRHDPDGALSLLEEQLRLCRQLNDPLGAARSIGNMVPIFIVKRNLDKAESLLDEHENLCRRLNHVWGLQAGYACRAIILRTRGDVGGALNLLKEQERLCRNLDDPGELAGSLGNQAVMLADQNDLDGALALLQEAEAIYRRLRDLEGIAKTAGNKANVFRKQGKNEKALASFEDEAALYRQLGDPVRLASTLSQSAVLLHSMGNDENAMARLKEEEELRRKVNDLNGWAACLHNQAVILQAREDLDKAVAVRKMQEKILRQASNPESLARCLAVEALLLAKTGRPCEAMPLAHEVLELIRTHGVTSLKHGVEPLLDYICSQMKGEKTTEGRSVMNEATGAHATKGHILLSEALNRRKALKDAYDKKQRIDFGAEIKAIYELLLSAHGMLINCAGAERKSAQCKSEMAWCLINLGQQKEAIECCKEALRAFQLLEHSILDQASCKETISQAYLRSGMKEEGMKLGIEAMEMLANTELIRKEVEWKARHDAGG
jgi:tetratricopeptide (TPR) repeat protein